MVTRVRREEQVGPMPRYRLKGVSGVGQEPEPEGPGVGWPLWPLWDWVVLRP